MNRLLGMLCYYCKLECFVFCHNWVSVTMILRSIIPHSLIFCMLIVLIVIPTFSSIFIIILLCHIPILLILCLTEILLHIRIVFNSNLYLYKFIVFYNLSKLLVSYSLQFLLVFILFLLDVMSLSCPLSHTHFSLMQLSNQSCTYSLQNAFTPSIECINPYFLNFLQSTKCDIPEPKPVQYWLSWSLLISIESNCFNTHQYKWSLIVSIDNIFDVSWIFYSVPCVWWKIATYGLVVFIGAYGPASSFPCRDFPHGPVFDKNILLYITVIYVSSFCSRAKFSL